MNKEKHLEMIENIILRMANCSFLIKGWTLTIVAAVFGLAAKNLDIKFIIIAYIIPSFWCLDAFYLSKERQYRSLYDKIRKLEKTDFSMSTKEFNMGKKLFFKNSEFILYSTLGFAPITCFVIILFLISILSTYSDTGKKWIDKKLKIFENRNKKASYTRFFIYLIEIVDKIKINGIFK